MVNMAKFTTGSEKFGFLIDFVAKFCQFLLKNCENHANLMEVIKVCNLSYD